MRRISCRARQPAVTPAPSPPLPLPSTAIAQTSAPCEATAASFAIAASSAATTGAAASIAAARGPTGKSCRTVPRASVSLPSSPSSLLNRDSTLADGISKFATGSTDAPGPVLVRCHFCNLVWHAVEGRGELAAEVIVRADDAALLHHRAQLGAGERRHELVARGRRAREGRRTDVARVVTLVGSVEHRMSGLRDEDHALPPS
eukprot:scaffold8761_cov97-Isochrysis_galbana.AAC.4